MSDDDWITQNRQELMAGITEVRRLLEARVGPNLGTPTPPMTTEPMSQDAPAAIDRLCYLFGLSTFERLVLLMGAGYELDGQFGVLCGAAKGDQAAPWPTVGLALNALSAADWSAFSELRPLRYWQLVRVATDQPLVNARISLDPSVLTFLIDGVFWDPRISDVIRAVEPEPPTMQSRVTLSAEIAANIRTLGPSTDIQLTGPGDKLGVLATAADGAGLQPFQINAAAIPPSEQDMDALARLWTRLARVLDGMLIVDADDLPDAEENAPPPTDTIQRFADRVPAPLLLMTREPLAARQRQFATFAMPPSSAAEQRACWEAELAANDVDVTPEFVDKLAGAFSFDERDIRTVLGMSGADTGDGLWQASLAQVRRGLDTLATRLPAHVRWQNFVAPPVLEADLKALIGQVRHRSLVGEQWGFGRQGARGHGLAALFAGTSGTGKTLAGELIAGELGYELFRIDLAEIVSKYIGETEKNLRRVFDQAEKGGVVLLFDEADALFGKRSKVKDSHDRHANIEVSYLLQRIESFTGLSILTTNLKSSIDTAFMRRFRFVLDFPFPDMASRARIWQAVMPQAAPVDWFDAPALAEFELSGGQIRNVAVTAAYAAAARGDAIGQQDFLAGIRAEYTKAGRVLTPSDIQRSMPPAPAPAPAVNEGV